MVGAGVQQPALPLPGDHGGIGSRSAAPTASAVGRTAVQEASVRAANGAPTIDVVGTGDGLIAGLDEARGSALQRVPSLAVDAKLSPHGDGLR